MRAEVVSSRSRWGNDESDHHRRQPQHHQNGVVSLSSSSGAELRDEEWETRKKVKTVTRRDVERRLERQVVLNDGRVIEESQPEVTVDTVEDEQTHEESGDEEDEELRRVSRMRGSPQLKFDGGSGRGWEVTTGDDVVGERFRRDITTRDVRQRSSTSAAARNLGEITPSDAARVAADGRDVRRFIRPYDDDPNNERALTLPARVVHKDSSWNRRVDREDKHEVDRKMRDGSIRTDRYVTREVLDDDGGETPEAGSSTESESFDGDGDAHTQRREERFVDYYRVPAGRPTSEGRHVRRGVHMTSHDRDARKVPNAGRPRLLMGSGGDRPPPPSHMQPAAIAYDGHNSDSTATDHKPPRPERPPSRSRRSTTTTTTTSYGLPTKLLGRSSTTSSNRGGERSDHPRRKSSDPKFHTIERGRGVSATSSSRNIRGVSSVSSRPRTSESDRSYRSRSMSRSSADVDNTIRRSDLDGERSGRLRRALSFSSRKSRQEPDMNGNGHQNQQPRKSSVLDSVKNMYATIAKSAKRRASNSSKGHQRKTSDWFDDGSDSGGGRRQPPPRRHRSSSYLAGSVGSANGGGYHPQRPRSSIAAPTMPSSSSLSRTRRSGGGRDLQPTRSAGQISPPVRRYTTANAPPRDSSRDDRESGAGRGGGLVRRRKTFGAYDHEAAMSGNRDPPRFEPERRSSSRASGGGGGSGGRYFGDDGEVEERRMSRPAPDMRRMLLDSVNVSRARTRDLSGGDGGRNATHHPIAAL